MKFFKFTIVILTFGFLGANFVFASEINNEEGNPAATVESSLDQNISKNGSEAPSEDGEVIVVYRKNATDKFGNISLQNFITKEHSAADMQIESATSFEALSKSAQSRIVHLKSKLSTDALIKKLKKDPRVKSVSPNYIFEVSSMPNDPYLNRQWGLEKIAAYDAWDTESNASEVVVAVVDTGIEYAHKDIARNIWVNQAELNGTAGVDDDGNGYIDDIHGYDFAANSHSDNDPDPSPSGYHGTHCAGIIGAEGNNNVGISGVAQNVKLMAVKASYDGHSLQSSDLLESMEYILKTKKRGVNIVSVNASYGGVGSSEAMKTAIKALGDAGIVFCAAAGNSGSDNDQRPHYPSSYDLPNIISVAATNKSDDLAYFSCYGAYSVDIAAPGNSIFSTISGGARPVGGTPIWIDNVESNETNWTTSGSHNTWAITESESSSGSHSWTDSPDGDYERYTDSYLTYAQDINLSAYYGERIGVALKVKYTLGKYAHFDIEMSKDSGATWSAFEPLKSTKNYPREQNSWTSMAMAIPEQFKTEHFRMRFKLHTSSYQADGIYIDDVSIGNVSRPYNYSYLSGTSMATPFVAGSIALLAKTFPDENVTQRIDRLLSGATPLPGVKGKVLAGGQLNLANAISDDLIVRHARIALAKNYGILPGDVLEINGSSLGEETGKVTFVADENTSTEADIVNWDTHKVTLTVPALPGKEIALSTADGVPALNVPIITAWDKTEDANGTYRSFRTGTMASYNDKVYYFGGIHYYSYYDENDTRHSSYDKNATWIYDPSADSWERAADIPTKEIRLHATAVLGDKAYIIGANTASGSDTNTSNFVYDFEADTWSPIAPLPETSGGRGTFGNAVAMDGKIYYFSGVSWKLDYYKTVNKNLYVYTPETDQWSDANVTLPVPVLAAYAVAHNHKIYLFGGFDDNNTVYDGVYTYAAGDSEWTKLETKMPVALARGGIATNGKEILIIGGDTNRINENNITRRVTTDKVLLYYPEIDTWKDLSQTIYAPLGKSYLTPMVYADGKYIKADAYKGRRMETLMDSRDYTNLAPVAQDINLSTTEDTGASLTLTGNDANGDSLTYTVTGPANGTLSGTAPNLTYTPNANYHGRDSFTYTVNDGLVDSESATVTITVTSVNDAPVAKDINLSTSEDTSVSLTLTSNDVDGDSLTYTVADPTHGTLSGTAPNLSYTPDTDYNGRDSFTYTVNDGSVDSKSATVNITVTAVNDAPVTEDSNTSTTPVKSSGGGCTYNPNAKGFDAVIFLMTLLSFFYPMRRKFYSHSA